MPSQILIVEDHESFRCSLRGWLETRFPNCVVIEADSGGEAVNLVRDNPPQVVLMDVTLPQMNGITATRQIKTISPTTVVIILTIHEDEVYRANALAAGAEAYVTKQEMYTKLEPILLFRTPVAGNGRTDDGSKKDLCRREQNNE